MSWSDAITSDKNGPRSEMRYDCSIYLYLLKIAFGHGRTFKDTWNLRKGLQLDENCEH